MAAFYSDLAIKIVDDAAHDGAGRWQLVEPLSYYSDNFGMVMVPAGFSTDLASVPRWAYYGLFGNAAHKAAVIHDWLIAEEKPRALADLEFMAAMKASRVPTWRRWPMYLAVRVVSLLQGSRDG